MKKTKWILCLILFLSSSGFCQCNDGRRVGNFLTPNQLVGNIVFDVTNSVISNIVISGDCGSTTINGNYQIDSVGNFSILNPSIGVSITGICTGDTINLSISMDDFCGEVLSGITVGVAPPTTGDDDDDSGNGDDDDSGNGNGFDDDDKDLQRDLGRSPIYGLPQSQPIYLDLYTNPRFIKTDVAPVEFEVNFELVWSRTSKGWQKDDSFSLSLQNGERYLEEGRDYEIFSVMKSKKITMIKLKVKLCCVQSSVLLLRVGVIRDGINYNAIVPVTILYQRRVPLVVEPPPRKVRYIRIIE